MSVIVIIAIVVVVLIVLALAAVYVRRRAEQRRVADSSGYRNRGPIASIGLAKASRLRGRSLSSVATHSKSIALWTLRSVPLGKYWRSSPLVFSQVARCHGAWGSQK